jgi:hypothetical protein
MSGLMKFYDYRPVEVIAGEYTESSAQVGVMSILPSYITALIFVGGEVVDFKTSPAPMVNGTLEVKVPTKYSGQPYSLFVFSAKDGYSNKDIGKNIWGVWFKELIPSSILSFGSIEMPRGSLLLVVPMKGAGFDIQFTRLGDSAAGHGEMVLK